MRRCRANFIFAAGLTLRGQLKLTCFCAYRLIYVIFVSYRIYFWRDAVTFSLASVRGSRRLYDEFLLERIRSTLPECKSARWIFPGSNFVILYFVSAVIAALQVAAIKNLFHFYSSPVALGQICFVLVLISPIDLTTTHDPISRNGYVPHWSLTIKLSSFSDLFMEVVYWMENEWRFIVSNRRRKALWKATFSVCHTT